jgi:MFS family permease
VALSYAAAFVARADLAVAGVFLPLWLTKHHTGLIPDGLGEAEQLAALDAAAAAGVDAGGKLIAIVGGCGLMFAPVIGILCDRIDRVTALAIGLAFNVVGYGLTFFVDAPEGAMISIAAAVIGCGQVGGVISSQVLIQQQAPAAYRGSVIGAFGTSGALGIMVTLLVGGYLFDAWTEAGPFVMLAGLNLIVVIAALAMRGRVARPGAGMEVRA